MSATAHEHGKRAARGLLAAALTLASATALMPLALASSSTRHSLYASRELWATIDVCNPKDRPYWIGIRGSMPSDGHPKDVMYMRFIVQVLNPATHTWMALGKDADSGFLAVGSSRSARQAGRSLELVPTSTSSTLSGLVEFQWRRGKRVVYQSSRLTSAGHKSLAGADPPNYSQATCTIG